MTNNEITVSPLIRTVVGDGIEIHHIEGGQGAPLVFVHGAFGDWRSWAPQWEAFVPHYRCISYSRRYSVPNRNNMPSADHSSQIEAIDLAALLRAWNASPAILVGTSYGALTALTLAAQAPHLIRALVVAEPPIMQCIDRVPGGTQVRETFECNVLRPAAQAFKCGEVEPAVHLLIEGINGTEPSSANTSDGVKRRLENARAMRMLSLSTNPFPVVDPLRLRSFDKPTLLLAGEKTQPIHDLIFQGLVDLMPQAANARIPDAGHGSHRDSPAAFNQIVLDFLKENVA